MALSLLYDPFLYPFVTHSTHWSLDERIFTHSSLDKTLVVKTTYVVEAIHLREYEDGTASATLLVMKPTRRPQISTRTRRPQIRSRTRRHQMWSSTRKELDTKASAMYSDKKELDKKASDMDADKKASAMYDKMELDKKASDMDPDKKASDIEPDKKASDMKLDKKEPYKKEPYKKASNTEPDKKASDMKPDKEEPDEKASESVDEEIAIVSLSAVNEFERYE
eukprot:545506-Amorphochlora_amoeboformis.AAC.1